ncbi:phosphoglycerate dehydrogenase [Alkaliphilus serpentinus]|uniref:phosphoglycerate dehydrogenase n=1 Tax=Alkaliphilus serpentinus TaxID=1482731 RepID=UPI002ED288AF
MKALFTYDYGKEKMKAIRDLGYEIMIQKEDEAVVTEDIEDAEILVCYNPFDTLDISKLSKLKWIQLSSIGIDQVPLEIVKERGITLTNNRGGYSIPMGEWIVLKMLEIYKNSYGFFKLQQQKRWKLDKSLLELSGKKVLFIGTGTIAQEAAKRLQGFDMDIMGINTRGRNTEYFHQCYGIDVLEEIIPMADIVVLTIPHTEKTHHLININRLKNMKRDALLINVSRGSIIDEGALINHLREGNLMGVALDVFEEEPLPIESPLWEMDRVYTTPHNSWISEMRNERKIKMIMENMRRYRRGEELINKIDIKRGY